ncbi:hypothetical protein GCM10010909_17530 [Acidocella aquatica]|uniref:RND efflux pump membrane fusion protein barrel-sandwich domain-containing protein n=1 Tax=Acidocella aquatica TaxID=1922313 RepID=A0ABQ6A906_9PROT|nr:efflux RND transporter periplasmic adaptor subunit [Acidocella aquatica]GLR67072.1 hypothetical protein GCM10010909_17530 [Acidocella aquatica]
MSENVRLHLLRWCVLCAGLAVFAGNGAQAAPAVGWVAAVAVMQTPRISGFASEQPGGLVTVASAQSGIVATLDVLPGQAVAAGQKIARLGGPQITAAMVQAQGVVLDAKAAQHAAEISLTAEQQKLRQHLSTLQLVAQAKAALAAAMARSATAAANLAALREDVILRSPLAGVVQSVQTANGDLLAAGQAAATIQPASGTWLRAVFYNAAAADIAPGTTGLFTPGNGGDPVPVSVRGALGAVQPDGGLPVALIPGAPLAPGIFGTVTLTLPARAETIVPADALILDKGQWWVMLHTAQGDHPAAVVPGPAQGDDTVIKSGLKPGEDVVVVNAYLLYHRGIAALYQPPD